MPETVTLMVNGAPVSVPAGSSIAAAMLQARAVCRTSVTGQPRTALCGMGICFECRATVDGAPHRRTCEVTARPGMSVETSL